MVANLLPSSFFLIFLSCFDTRCGVTGVIGEKGIYGEYGVIGTVPVIGVANPPPVRLTIRVKLS
jgi:hypothetical protein